MVDNLLLRTSYHADGGVRAKGFPCSGRADGEFSGDTLYSTPSRRAKTLGSYFRRLVMDDGLWGAEPLGLFCLSWTCFVIKRTL